jgi:hypothetical protein
VVFGEKIQYKYFLFRNQNYLGVKYLLEHKVTTVPPGVSETALHVAAENNNLEIGQ